MLQTTNKINRFSFAVYNKMEFQGMTVLHTINEAAAITELKIKFPHCTINEKRKIVFINAPAAIVKL